MIVIPASAAKAGIHASIGVPMPSTYRRMIATNPAAFGATDSHATNGELAASYVSGAHIWKGKAAILKPSPARSNTMPSCTSGFPSAIATGMASNAVLPVAP